MSNNHDGKYIFYTGYTEYYIISGVYQIVNVVNEILTYSACCSDNIKGYLHNKVVSKKATLSELMRNNRECVHNNTSINNSNENNDLDEDGFVVIKMRRPKKNKPEHDHSTSKGDSTANSADVNTNDSVHDNSYNVTMDQANKDLKPVTVTDENIINDIIIQQVVEDIIKNVIKKLDTSNISL